MAELKSAASILDLFGDVSDASIEGEMRDPHPVDEPADGLVIVPIVRFNIEGLYLALPERLIVPQDEGLSDDEKNQQAVTLSTNLVRLGTFSDVFDAYAQQNGSLQAGGAGSYLTKAMWNAQTDDERTQNLTAIIGLMLKGFADNLLAKAGLDPDGCAVTAVPKDVVPEAEASVE